MPIKNERRYYLTLPNPEYKKQLMERAKQAKLSTSAYIVYQLELVERIKADPVGAALIENINGSQ